MSRTLDLPTEAHLWQTSEIPTLVLTERELIRVPTAAAEKGVKVVELSLTPAKAMATYTAWISPFRNGTLAARAIAEGAVQKFLPYCPKNYWRSTAPTPVGTWLTMMTEALSLERVLASCGFRLLSRRLYHLTAA